MANYQHAGPAKGECYGTRPGSPGSQGVNIPSVKPEESAVDHCVRMILSEMEIPAMEKPAASDYVKRCVEECVRKAEDRLWQRFDHLVNEDFRKRLWQEREKLRGGK